MRRILFYNTSRAWYDYSKRYKEAGRYLSDSGVSVWTPAATGAVAFIILGGTIIPFTLFLAGVKLIGPTKASLISCFEPLSTILFTVFFLGTVLLPVDYAGMAFIIITVFMLSMKKNT